MTNQAIIFSKDRAMQLQAVLESLSNYCSDLNNILIRVLYTTSSLQHELQYRELRNRFSSIKFIQETNFRHQLIRLAKQTPYLLLLVDDIIFYRPFTIGECLNTLNAQPEAISVVLTLGSNTTYCHTKDKLQLVPPIENLTNRIVRFHWPKAAHDFGYPLEISGSLYRTEQLLELLCKLEFNNPNHLEASLYRSLDQIQNYPWRLMFRDSVAFCNPLNLVQQVFANRIASEAAIDVKTLADNFDRNLVIDLSTYQQIHPNAAHYETAVKFRKASNKAHTTAQMQHSDPFVSVIIPTYNGAAFLPEAVESIDAQHYQNLEIIIVNDGSDDNSLDVAHHLAEKHAHLNIRIIDKKNGGLADARNAGIKVAKGEWILPLDCDDRFEPVFLKHAAHVIKTKPEINLVFANILKFGASDKTWTPPEYSWEELQKRNTFPYASLYRRELWELAEGYNPSIPWGAEDWNFWLSCASFGLKPFRIESPLFRYRVHPAGSMYTRMMEHWSTVKACLYTMHPDLFSVETLIRLHPEIGAMDEETRDRIAKISSTYPNLPMPHFWMGLYHENAGRIGDAMAEYLQAAALAPFGKWQPHLRLYLLNKSIGRHTAAKIHALEALHNCSSVKYFMDKKDLENLLFTNDQYYNNKYHKNTTTYDNIRDKNISTTEESNSFYNKNKIDLSNLCINQNEYLRKSHEIVNNIHTNKKRQFSLKILFVCHDFPPYRCAGAQMYALNLALTINQSAKGHVEIFYPTFRDPNNTDYSIKSKTYAGITVHELSKPKVGEIEKVYDKKAARSFERFLNQHHFDIIHFHGLGQLSFALPFVARKKNIPAILTLHDHWFLCDRWHMIRRDQSICSGPQSLEKCTQCHILDNDLPASTHMKELVLRYQRTRKNIALKAFHSVDLVLAPSNYLKNKFNLYNFVDVQIFPLGLPAKPPISLGSPHHETLTFGYLGQLIRGKGINLLLNAFRDIPGDIRLLIWGDHEIPQPYQASIRELAKKDPRVHLMGKYDPTQLPTIFSQIDVAVIPSLMENYPITALEALHYKTPVIASRVGGIPEIVIHHENGLLFEVGSIVELKNALIKIVDNPDLIQTFRGQIKQVRTIEDDARETLNAYRTLNIKHSRPSNEEYSSKRPLTVQFYVYKNVHWPMFESLHEYLHRCQEVSEIVICLPNIPNLANTDNGQLVQKLLNLDARIVTDPRQAKADITFIADAIAGKVYGCGRIVNLGHGTISKGYYFTQSVWTERENWVDLLCVPGEYARERMAPILRTKVVATGMPKLDPVFAGRHTRADLCAKLQLDARKKIVLYAPTFNLTLSSAFLFAKKFHLLDAPDRYILIKLHGSTLANIVEQYRQTAKNSKNIIYIEDPNIAPYIGGADVMISDVSSAFMEFMALDKPVILFNNPELETYHGYNSENIEYAWRDLGTQVDSFEQMQFALDKLLRSDDGKSSIRLNYSEQLFADRTGHASSNVWREAQRLLSDQAAPPLPMFSILIYLEPAAHILVRKLIHNLQFYSVLPLELVLVQPAGSLPVSFINTLKQFNEFIRVEIVDAPSNASLGQALSLGAKMCSGDYICLLRDDVSIFKNFDYILYQTFVAHPNISLLTGLTNLKLSNIYAFERLENEHNESGDALAYRFINHFEGTSIDSLPSLTILPPLTAVRTRALNLEAGDFERALSDLTAQGDSAICLSLFYMCLDTELRQNILEIWRKRDSIPSAKRLGLSHEIQQYFCCPDLAEDMVRILLKLDEASSLLPQAFGSSLHTRYYDLEYKKWLLDNLPSSNPWKQELRHDCEIISALLAATSGKTSSKQSFPVSQALDLEPPKHNSRILFFFFKNVHIPILLPIYQALKKHDPGVEIGFSYLPPMPQIRAGLSSEELKTLAQTGERIYSTPQEFHPDLTFIADSVYPWVEGCGKLVHVGHGVLSKGQYYTDTLTARREEQADLICVPGKHHQQIMRRIISKPVVATGMCKLDALFSGAINRESVLKQYGLPKNYRYILFAPTFNDELSAIPFVMDRIGEVLPNDNTLLIVKLHASTKAEYKRMYNKLPAKDKRVIYADELDITPFLALCDIMISDVSSAMMEFAALDKPVILFNNPNWTNYPNYNPSDIEFQWRDIGIEVKTLEEIRTAVSRYQQNPQLHSDQRQKYTDLLFANKQSGRAAERIIKLALSLLPAKTARA